MAMERERRVNPECPNASNPFHRCAEYCAPRSPSAAAAAAKPRIESPKSDQTGDRTRTHDEMRRAKRGGSGGLPLYVFLQNGAIGDSRKVDSRCPNASNPFHVCAEYCFIKLNEIDRREGSKSPSFLSRHSSSSSAENDANLGENKRVDPKCANASNPFHVCADYCFNKSHENKSREISRAEPGTPVANGLKMGKTRSNETDQAEEVENGIQIGENRRVDPRCANASNPYHVCADYCFSRSSEMNHKEGEISVAREAKGVLTMVERRDVHPNCANASNPFHKCADYCLKKLNEAT